MQLIEVQRERKQAYHKKCLVLLPNTKDFVFVIATVFRSQQGTIKTTTSRNVSRTLERLHTVSNRESLTNAIRIDSSFIQASPILANAAATYSPVEDRSITTSMRDLELDIERLWRAIEMLGIRREDINAT